MNRLFRILTLSTLLVAGIGFAPTLGMEMKRNIAVNSADIRLGDLFPNAGKAHNVIVDEAPAPGKQKHIAVGKLQDIAAYYGLDWTPPYGMKRITITRNGEILAAQDIEELASESLRAAGVEGRFRIRLSSRSTKIILPAGTGLAEIEETAVAFNRRTRHFSIAYDVPDGAGGRQKVKVQGRIDRLTSVPVLARAVTTGHILTENDFRWMDMPANRVNSNVVHDTSRLIGQEVRRTLQANQPLRAIDVRRPLVIRKGEKVMVSVVNGNLAITMTGVALENGGMGDIIRISNTSSHQTIEGLVEGRGKASVMVGHRTALAGQ